jgi:hypothetical protein
MSDYARIIKKDFKIKVETIVEDIKNRRNPEFYRPIGTQIYAGLQGSGKTMSAVHDLRYIHQKYPKCIIVTNLDLKFMNARSLDEFLLFRKSWGDDDYIQFSDMDSLGRCLVEVNNELFGVHYLIDEIHTYFNSLDSKNIPMFVFTEISQQRKQRKSICGTSQIFMRLAKAFREQCDNVIFCDTYFGKITKQEVFSGSNIRDMPDGSINPGTRRKLGFFMHSMQDRNSYDTFQKVVSAQEQYENPSVFVGDFKSPKFGNFKKRY